jgi:hypothetical protein
MSVLKFDYCPECDKHLWHAGAVCYTLAEIKELTGQSPELLRDIHRLKRGFGATLEKVNQDINASSSSTRYAMT